MAIPRASVRVSPLTRLFGVSRAATFIRASSPFIVIHVFIPLALLLNATISWSLCDLLEDTMRRKINKAISLLV